VSFTLATPLDESFEPRPAYFALRDALAPRGA
jgi:hypothetical protein